MLRVYTTLSGHRIEIPEPTAEVSAFLARVQGMVDDPAAPDRDMIAAIYGPENPIMDRTIFPERGAVTCEVLDNPVYAVLQDMLYRKTVAQGGKTIEEIAARYTLPVSEVAERLGVHPTAVQKAIGARRVGSWVKGGKHWLDPNQLGSLGVARRGPLPRIVEPIEYRAGNEGDAMLRIRYAEGGRTAEPDSKAAPVAGRIERWRRLGVLHGRGGKLRFFILEPAAEPGELALGALYVRGRFKTAEKVNNTKAAREAWEEFSAL